MIVIQLFCFIINYKYNFKIIFGSLTVIIYLVNCIFILPETKYIKLAEKYKDAKRKTLKGWGIVFYLVSSFVLFAISVIFLKVFTI
jgi:hypothetical protein